MICNRFMKKPGQAATLLVRYLADRRLSPPSMNALAILILLI
jgi:hypothetical protein